jgi:hypothetical protein
MTCQTGETIGPLITQRKEMMYLDHRCRSLDYVLCGGIKGENVTFLWGFKEKKKQHGQCRRGEIAAIEINVLGFIQSLCLAL